MTELHFYRADRLLPIKFSIGLLVVISMTLRPLTHQERSSIKSLYLVIILEHKEVKIIKDNPIYQTMDIMGYSNNARRGEDN